MSSLLLFQENRSTWRIVDLGKGQIWSQFISLIRYEARNKSDPFSKSQLLNGKVTSSISRVVLRQLKLVVSKGMQKRQSVNITSRRPHPFPIHIFVLFTFCYIFSLSSEYLVCNRQPPILHLLLVTKPFLFSLCYFF